MFDVYHKWLGIPPADQPPNHYRLLAITLFEDDPTVIEMAADQRMGHLRTFRTSQDNALAERLLNEVAAAKICLLRPERKAQYDAVLRAAQTPIGPPAYPAAFANPAPPTVFTEPTPASAFAAPVVPPEFMEQEPSFAEQDPPSAFYEPAQQSFVAEPAPPPAAPRTEIPANYLEADPLAGFAVSYSKPARRARNKLPMFAIFGPIAGVVAVATAIMVLNSS